MKDGTYLVRLDNDGVPMLTNQINMSDGYWVSDDSGVSVHGELESNALVDSLKLMDIEDGEIVGVWQNKELSYIDRSYHFRNKDTALKMGEAFDQIAIWDCKNSKALDIRYQ
jgi:hypothetical protein